MSLGYRIQSTHYQQPHLVVLFCVSSWTISAVLVIIITRNYTLISNENTFPIMVVENFEKVIPFDWKAKLGKDSGVTQTQATLPSPTYVSFS